MKPSGRHIVAEFIHCSRGILNNRDALEEALKDGLKQCHLDLININSYQFDPVGVTAVAIIGESHVAIHTYPEAGHISLDIFTCSANHDAETRLLRFFKRKFRPKTFRVIELRRGNPLEVQRADWMTSFSGKGFEVQYHIKNHLFSKRSKYQQIDIIENETFGRMLFLDRDLQIAEADSDTYNTHMILPVVEAGNGLRKIAILGGGDGGVLSELLKYKPDKAVLVEIDEDVISASKRYLTSICRNSFSKPNVEVVIQDARKYLKPERRFDGIVYDLTMYPEALTRMERREFLDGLFSGIRRNMTKKGVVSIQCGSAADMETLKLLSRILKRHFADITYREVFIPSFCENWVFASARAK